MVPPTIAYFYCKQHYRFKYSKLPFDNYHFRVTVIGCLGWEVLDNIAVNIFFRDCKGTRNRTWDSWIKGYRNHCIYSWVSACDLGLTFSIQTQAHLLLTPATFHILYSYLCHKNTMNFWNSYTYLTPKQTMKWFYASLLSEMRVMVREIIWLRKSYSLIRFSTWNQQLNY